jgi:hypothetical protein
MKRKILTIDGGGIKGIIPAAICVAIEEYTGKPINEIFHLISGTSTGTILGAGLSMGIPAQVMLDMYMNYGEEIFTKRVRWFRPWQYITKPKYNRKYILKYLNRYYGGDTYITDICKTNFMCAAYDVIKQDYEFFTSWQSRYSDRKLVDIVLYSMSAITYFGKSIDKSHNAIYTDGAMELFNSTPLTAAIETPKLGWGNDDNYILNLGCGELIDEDLKFKDVEKWNNIGQVLKIYLPKRVKAINKLKETALKSPIIPHHSFEKIDPIIGEHLMSMDKVSNSAELLRIGELAARNVVNLEVLK